MGRGQGRLAARRQALSYAINLDRRTRREIERLNPPILSRIVSAIDRLADQPRPPGCKKLAGSRGEWRLRVGDYRILYEIDDRDRRVTVYAVGHRREIYR